jgi:sigma-B regulation protein RsbU (phosphoserine phosphatase)
VKITSPRYDTVIQHRRVSLISELIAEDGRTLGRLEVSVRFDYLIGDLIERIHQWQSSRVFLVDDGGRVLTCTVPGGRHQLGETGDAVELETLAAMKDRPFGTILGQGHPPEWVSGFHALYQAPWRLIFMVPGREMLEPIIRFRTYYALIGLAFIVSVVLVMRLVIRKTAAAIRSVSTAAGRVARGEFTEPLAVTSGDEVGQLTESFNAMALQLEERMHLKQRMELAMEVQQSLLPGSAPLVRGYDIAGRSLYSEETGGDYFDFIGCPALSCERLGIAVGDVTGHGIGAALLMTTARALLRGRMAQPGDLGRIVSDVNRLLCADTEQRTDFMTLFVMTLDLESGAIEWVRAGHDPAILYDPVSDRFEVLRGPGLALGVDESAVYLAGAHPGLHQNQVLVLGTDGIWETENASGERFGKKRFENLIRRHYERPAQQIGDAVTAALAEFRGSAPQHDDITLVVIRKTG